jgi:DNA-binding CsgD family transcriptional regulator
MSQGFDARLRDAFRAADADRNKVQKFEKQAREDPSGTAVAVFRGIPDMMEHKRASAAELYGVDIADQESIKAFEPDGLEEASLLLMKANMYLVLAEYQYKLDAYAADDSLSREELAAKVCQVELEALQTTEAIMLHNLHEVRVVTSSGGSEEAAKLAKDEEARRLAGHLATRISLRKNLRLAKALDSNRPTTVRQFQALLQELCIRSPEVWNEHHRIDWRLLTTRSAVVRKLEGRVTAPREEQQLAQFAEREELLRLARSAGLTPQEFEVFKLFIDNPNFKYREVADKLGISVQQVGVIKHRIKHALSAN